MSETVELTLPLHPELIILARLAAATVGARAGFGIEEIEDLRLAVDELSLSIIPQGSEGRISFIYEWDEGLVEISCCVSSVSHVRMRARDAVSESLSAKILGALVDEHGTSEAEGEIRAWLKKRRTGAAV